MYITIDYQWFIIYIDNLYIIKSHYKKSVCKGNYRFVDRNACLNRSDLHDLFFKSLVGHAGFIFDFTFIGIDRID